MLHTKCWTQAKERFSFSWETVTPITMMERSAEDY